MCVVYLPNDALDELDENLMKNIISVEWWNTIVFFYEKLWCKFTFKDSKPFKNINVLF